MDCLWYVHTKSYHFLIIPHLRIYAALAHAWQIASPNWVSLRFHACASVRLNSCKNISKVTGIGYMKRLEDAGMIRFPPCPRGGKGGGEQNRTVILTPSSMIRLIPKPSNAIFCACATKSRGACAAMDIQPDASPSKYAS